MKRLFKPSVLAVSYSIAAALPAACNFIITILLVRSLGIHGFAEWAIIEPILLIAASATPLGTQFGILNATATKLAPPQIALASGFVVTLSVSLFVAFICGMVLGHLYHPALGVTFGAALCADALAAICASMLRGLNRPLALAAFEMVRSLGLLAAVATLYLLSPDRIDSPSEFLGYRFAVTTIAIAGTVYLVGLKLQLERSLGLRMISYGLPLVGATMIGLTMNNVDRYLLSLLGWGAPLITTYVAHQRLAGVLNVATVTPFQLWFPGEAMRRGVHGNEQFFRLVLVGLLAWLAVIECFVLTGAPIAWSWLFPEIPFQPLLFLLLAASVVPQALAIAVNIGALQRSKTSWNILGASVGCSATIAFGLPLTALFGPVGAAGGRLGGYIIYMLAFRTISNRVAPVRYFIGRLSPFCLAFLPAAMIPFAGLTGVPVWILLVATLALAALGLLANTRWKALA